MHLTCVVMPDSHFGEISQTEDIGEAKCIHLLAFELVGLAALFQRQCPRVSILPEDDHPYVSVSAGS